MKHTYSVLPHLVTNATEALDENDIDYEINGNQFTVDDDNDLLFQSCLIAADIDFSN